MTSIVVVIVDTFLLVVLLHFLLPITSVLRHHATMRDNQSY